MDLDGLGIIVIKRVSRNLWLPGTKRVAPSPIDMQCLNKERNASD